ncbi:hypothetical protein NQ176_g5366 [Zarea fungicola]|uniref:Uncharacterized protein n=1 Tax=Zarea fungicola TaxID=93591 RepID=A0ACC1NA40_9HYPO|nr:hypothetical protein NQ176_g5366 [Lecanicillium fungicola]
MHVLSGFSSRRKTPKPRDLHIRKVSFSGSSLCSGCSISSSSTTSTSTARGPSHTRSNSNASYDPLRLHPIVQPPPRLHERPYIVSPKRQVETPRSIQNELDTSISSNEGNWYGYGVSIFEDDSDSELEEDDEDDVFDTVQSSSMPPMSGSMDHTDDESDDEDYFFMQLAKRPPMHRSHWSESTIQTLAQLTPVTSTTAITPTERLQDPIEQARMMLPNFSYKHATVPARPLMKTMDSVEHLAKRGGWKRKAVALDQENVAPSGMF